MNVVEITRPGGPEVLALREVAIPAPGPGQILVRGGAAAVNRPDIQQRRGLYPPPPGTTDILGLDIAGVVEQVGAGVSSLRAGDRICALANGGGYAEYCIVPEVQCMPLPRGFDMVHAASLPEAFFTAWNNVIMLGRLGQGETLLVQGGTSGVGMAAIQIARSLRKARVLATASTEPKRRVCLDIGCEAVVNYKDADWAEQLRGITAGQGIDVILDGQAGPYTDIEMGLLAHDGRLVLIASHLGKVAEVNVNDVVRRRLTLTGSTLRPRPPEYKGRIARDLVAHVWPLLESAEIKVHICKTFPLSEVASAHALLDQNEQIGKVVLVVDPRL